MAVRFTEKEVKTLLKKRPECPQRPQKLISRVKEGKAEIDTTKLEKKVKRLEKDYIQIERRLNGLTKWVIKLRQNKSR